MLRNRRSTHAPWNRRCLELLAMVPVLVLGGCHQPHRPAAGTVIDVCRAGGVGAAGGLLSGDVVVSWCGDGAEHPVRSPFELWLAERREAARGAVVLRIVRDEEDLDVTLPSGLWEIELRPVLGRVGGRRYAEAGRLTMDGDHEAALALWRDIAALERDRAGAAAWCLMREGATLRLLGRAAEGERAFDRATELSGDPSSGGMVRAAAAEVLEGAGRKREAEELYLRAVELYEAHAADPALMGHALMGLARCDVREGGDAARRALGLFEELRKDSLEAASARALVAGAAFYRSNLDGAEQQYRAALATARRRAPGGTEVVKYLSNLGLVAMKRGDLDGARNACLEALELVNRVEPGGRTAAFTANFLGLVAKNMGQYREARRWYEEALEAFRRARPGGDEVAGVLNNLGNVALRLGDLSAARGYHQEALTLRERLRPDGADVASSLNNLGEIARKEGDLGSARSYLEGAVELKRELAPGTLWVASSLRGLGEVARLEGRMEAARSLQGEALRIERSVLSGGLGEASSLICLGQVAEEGGRPDEAVRLWRRAIRLIEVHREDLGLVEDERSTFGAPFYWVYVRLAGLLVRRERGEEAFELLERARARALRAAISDRLPRGVPAAQRTAWRRLQRAERATYRRLTTLDGKRAGDEITALRSTLRELADERRCLVREIRETDPRFDAFTVPTALTLENARAALEPRSTLLLFSVGETETVVFALAPLDDAAGWEARVIPVGADELARRVDVLRALIARGRVVDSPEPALLYQARALSRLLLQPVRRFVERADRVIVAPDGVLLGLPFAALRVDWSGDGTWLGEGTSVCRAPSATVFAQLHREPQARSMLDGPIEVFAEPEVKPEVVRGHRLRPLRWASNEAASIADLFGDRARVHRGPRADEATALGLGGKPRIVHFAAHAVLDAREPLESALLLAPSPDVGGAAGDGVLSAWEVMEGPAIGADLVTLSACETARGGSVAGEGVMGLARAFHYAGARTVVASSWEVPDRSTSELMRRFYANLRKGSSIAGALRQARAELISGPTRLPDGSVADFSHPYHWAAFAVIGDCG